MSVKFDRHHYKALVAMADTYIEEAKESGDTVVQMTASMFKEFRDALVNVAFSSLMCEWRWSHKLNGWKTSCNARYPNKGNEPTLMANGFFHCPNCGEKIEEMNEVD